MKIGVVYPQIEYPSDAIAIRDYAQTAEGLGYSHILAYDHVLGANPDRPGGWQGPYTCQNPFQEPLILFSFMTAITKRVNFTTGVIILPQRQTALFAKQVATLDVLSNGRTRIGIGLGWNTVEYASLNADFHTRGKRIEEQVEVLKLLWTQSLVNFQGRWHTIPDAGLNPMPVQQPIPIWYGGHAEPMLRRAAQTGQGWMPNYRTPAEAQPALVKLRTFLTEAGRSWTNFGLEARLSFGNGNPDTLTALLRDWQTAGATHITVNTMGLGYQTAAQHLSALEKFARIVSL